MLRVRRRVLVAFISICVILLVALIFHRVWLTWLGSELVDDEAPFRADAISVLGGDFRGGRLLTASKLARNGFAPVVLVSGSGPIYGANECDLAVSWAVSQGYPREMFVKVPTTALSTEEEAQEVINVMRRRHIKSFLLVTSSYHTRRAARIFHHLAPEIRFHPVASPDLYFTTTGWWKTREGQKTFAFEWTKTLANWAGD